MQIELDTRQPAIEFSIEGRRQEAHPTWFRGEYCNFNPDVENMRSKGAVLRHVLAGWLPPEPMIGSSTNIVAFGSCFAEHISTYLGRRKYKVATTKDGKHGDAYVVRFGEGMVNTFVIRQQFEWAYENRIPEQELWPSDDASALGYQEKIRISTRTLLDSADVFIITLGLSEIWYDEITGGVFWKAVPTDKYDPTRHKFRVSSVAENVDNIKAIYRLIRKYRPQASVIFAISPIPLVATFRPISCITANSVSKANLRAAVDEAYREINEPDTLFYWPSYEIIMDVFGDRWEPDRRHIKAPILDFVMTLFEYAWCTGPRSQQRLQQAWIEANSPAASPGRGRT